MMSFDDIDLEERFFPNMNIRRNSLVREFMDLFSQHENGIITVKERLIRAFENIISRLSQKREQIVALLPTIYQLSRDINQAQAPAGANDVGVSPTLSQKMEGRMRELEALKITEPEFYDSLAGSIEFRKKESENKKLLADFVDETAGKLFDADRIEIFEKRCLEVVDGLDIADFRKGGEFEFEIKSKQPNNEEIEEDKPQGLLEPAKLPPAKLEDQQKIADLKKKGGGPPKSTTGGRFCKREA